MFVRRRPLLRAAVVGGGAYVAGKRRAEYQAQQQFDEDQRSADPGQDSGAQPPGGQYPAPPRSSTPSVPDQLTQLNALHDQGALSDAEFAAAKTRLLGG
jgi:hypothetical protein